MRGRTLATLAAIGVGSAWVATIAVTAACTKGSKGGAADGPSEPTPIATLADAGPARTPTLAPINPATSTIRGEATRRAGASFT